MKVKYLNKVYELLEYRANISLLKSATGKTVRAQTAHLRIPNETLELTELKSLLSRGDINGMYEISKANKERFMWLCDRVTEYLNVKLQPDEYDVQLINGNKEKGGRYIYRFRYKEDSACLIIDADDINGRMHMYKTSSLHGDNAYKTFSYPWAILDTEEFYLFLKHVSMGTHK